MARRFPLAAGRPRPDPAAMRRTLILMLLAAPALALAQPAPAPAPPAAPRTGPEGRKAELDRAFEALRTAPDEAGAALVEGRIRTLWAQGATPSVGLLLRRGARNLEAEVPAEALEDYDAAITLAPDFAEAWFLRAQANLRSGAPAAAARDLQEVLRLEPRHWPALTMLAAIQDEAGDPQGALRSLRAALAINPRMPGGEIRLREQRRKAEGDIT